MPRDYTVWVTQERERVPVVEMTDKHLLCTIRMLRGRSPHGTTWHARPATKQKWLDVLTEEAYRRGLFPTPVPAGLLPAAE